MKNCIGWLCLGMWTSLQVWAQDGSLEIQVGARFAQSSENAVQAAAGTNAYFFRAFVGGISSLAPVVKPQFKTPKGNTLALTENTSTEDYEYIQNFSTSASRDAAFSLGRYDFSATLNFLGLTKAHAVLTAGTTPTAPHVVGYAAAQSIDPDSSFTLQWTAFVEKADGDVIDLEIFDNQHQSVTQITDLDASTTEWEFSSGELPADQAMTVQIRFRKFGATSDLDSGELLAGRPAWISETVCPIRTKASGSGQTDVTPPTLTTVLPGDGQTMTSALDVWLLAFDEPMDPTLNNIQIHATLNGSPVQLNNALLKSTWLNENKNLLLSYNQTGGGWPSGWVVTWVLNSVPGAVGNFKDVAGNELATTSGTFTTAGGIDPCQSGNQGGTPNAAFFLSKEFNYLQSGNAVPVVDTALGADVLAFFDAPALATSTAIVTLKVPTSNPFAFKLKVLTPPSGLPDFSIRTFQEHFADASSLEAAYIAGNYGFEIRDTGAKVTNSVLVSVSANSAPPVPHFANFAAAQTIDAASDFKLLWDAFAGATTNTAFVSIAILDTESNVVFQAPDPCHGISLAPNAAGVVIPAKTLNADAHYTAQLTFAKIVDHDKSLTGIPGFGFAFVQNITRTAIVTRGSNSGLSPSTLSEFKVLNPGSMQLRIACSPGHLLNVESASSVAGPYSVIFTTNPPSSPFVITLPTSGANQFLRAKNP